MANGKKSSEIQHAKQLSELLRHYGISSKPLLLTPSDRKKLDELFPE